MKHFNYRQRASLATIRLFPQFAHLSEVPQSKQLVSAGSESMVKVDEIERMIFAPDPVTGIPRSDIAAILSKDLSPEIRDYINNTIMSNSNPTGSPAPDADTALVSIKDRRESVVDYAKRLREMLISSE